MHGIIKVTKWRGLNTYTGLPQSKPQVLMLTPCLNELGPEQPWGGGGGGGDSRWWGCGNREALVQVM